MLRPFIIACVLATSSAAQVQFTGVIEPFTLASFCQEESHYLTCTGPTPFSPTGVKLKSSTLDLDDYVGINARFTAELRGVECDIYDVTAVQVPPPATLVRCGNPVPGCPVRFRVGPTGVIGQYLLFFGLAPDFLPLDPILGTLLLQGPVVLAAGSTAGVDAAVDLIVPTFPVLTGTSFWFQGARRDIGPIGPWMLTNAVCLTVLGPSPPCSSPDC